MTRIEAQTVKTAYLAAGGTEDGWQANRESLVESARQQAAVNAAVAEAAKTPTMNELLRSINRDGGRASFGRPEGSEAA